MNRFEMAYALVARAKMRRNEIGDHGDPYEEAILKGIVSIELQFILKEVLEHLRSALDYSAIEVVERLTGKKSRRIHFPIIQKNISEEEIRHKVKKALPGVNKEILQLFEMVQKSDWISKLATICNESKHQNLSVVNVDKVNVEIYNKQGIVYTAFRKEDGTSPFKRGLPLTTIIKGKATYVKIDSIDEELLGFLDQCIVGTKEILDNIVKLINT